MFTMWLYVILFSMDDLILSLILKTYKKCPTSESDLELISGNPKRDRSESAAAEIPAAKTRKTESASGTSESV